ncbi:MAG: TolC family protein [Peptococcaceae bacterium]|nr:TolC family protein [Peptococcaceae bacterium]
MKKFNRKSKIRMILSMVLVILLAFPMGVMAKTEDKKDKDKLLKVEFSEIGPLVQLRNLTVEELEEAIEDAEDLDLSDFDKMIAKLDELKKSLEGMTPALPGAGGGAGSGDPGGDPGSGDPGGGEPSLPPISGIDIAQNLGLIGLLEAQISALRQQRSAMKIDIEKLELQLDMTIDTITSAMEGMFISYNSLGRQLELLENQKELADSQLKVLKLQEELGLVTELTLEKTKNEIAGLTKSINDLTRARETIKEQFNLMLSYEFDKPLELGGVPRVVRPDVVRIDVEDDYEDAWEDSYEVLLNDDRKSKREGDAIRKFRQGFYAAYNTLQDKQAALELEEDKLRTAKKSWELAELKYSLGMLSELQYKTEKNSYLSQQITVELAKDAVFQAYRNYEWAKRGLIVSSTSTSNQAAPTMGH